MPVLRAMKATKAHTQPRLVYEISRLNGKDVRMIVGT